MKKLLLGLVAILSITTRAATKEGTGLGYKDDIQWNETFQTLIVST